MRYRIVMTRNRLDAMKFARPAALSLVFLGSMTLAGQACPPPTPWSKYATDSTSISIFPGCEFAANSWVFTDLVNHPPVVDPNSAKYVNSLLNQMQIYFGAGAPTADINIVGSPPIYLAGPRAPTESVYSPDSYLASFWTAVPIPSNFAPAPDSDAEALIYQQSTNTLWEFWLLSRSGSNVTNSAGKSTPGWRANWGGRMQNVNANPGYWITDSTGYKFGAYASGVPVLATSITLHDVMTGHINHPLALEIPNPAAGVYSFPAQRTDGGDTSPDAIPEGTIFFLPADVDTSARAIPDPLARMVAQAAQHHGIIVADYANAIMLRAENPGPNYPGWAAAHMGGSPRGHNSDPWTSPGGVLNCPDYTGPESCWPITHMQGVPWAKMQVETLQLQTVSYAKAIPGKPAAMGQMPSRRWY